MGFNTVVHILNDMLYQLQEHPKEFVDYIMSRLNGGPKWQGNPVDGAVQVMQSHHASDYMLYLSGGNTILPFCWTEAERLVKEGHVDYVRKCIKEAKLAVKNFERHINEELAKKDPLLYKAKMALKDKKKKV